MLNDDEAVELSALRRRAFAPGGALTGAEAERMRELEDRRVDGGEKPPVAVANSEPDLPDLDDGVDASEATTAAEEPGPRVRRPRRPWMLLATAALALIVGVAAGWALTGAWRPASSLSLTEEQQSRGQEILPEGADGGSLVALGEHEGVVAWYVTTEGGKRTCLLLDDGTDGKATCTETSSLPASPLIAVYQYRSTGESAYLETTIATLSFTPDARPAVGMQSYRQTDPYSDSFATEAEAAMAEGLADAGFRIDATGVVGYRGGVPIWASARGMDTCLVYVADDAPIRQVCQDPDVATPDPLVLEFAEGEGATLVRVTIELAWTPQLGQYLTITERPAEAVTVDAETGEIVEPTIDDTTEEVGEQPVG